MNLRVYREYEWRCVPGHEVRYGGPPIPMEKIAKDKLQVLNEQGQWEDIPVFVAVDPEDPRDRFKRSRRP